MNNKILLLTLKTFSATGGIEKVCKVAGKALYEQALTGPVSFQIHCMYDKQSDANDNKYFPGENFRGFGVNKLKFIYRSVREGCRSNTVILSHANLLLVGWLIKLFSPKTKLMLFAHGIEIWDKLGSFKTMMLKRCDLLLPVSRYTSQKIQEVHGIMAERCKVLNNSLDPYLPIVSEDDRHREADELRQHYGYTKNDKIIFTLTRLSSKERYKGYDKVLEALQEVVKKYPEVRYLIAGKYDEVEKENLVSMARALGLEQHLTIAGFIHDESLVAHFSLADIYAMPSRKEGFGIVFVEAMYYGVPVIAGNLDGSVDALMNGQLGGLINPTDSVEIEKALMDILDNRQSHLPNRNLMLENFGYEGYKRKIVDVLMC